MAGTVTIPLTTFPPGTRTTPGAGIADADSTIELILDRTVSGGLNSLTAASQINCQTEQSNDSGSTWQTLAGFTDTGGTILGKNGQPITANTSWTQLNPGTSRQVRAIVTVTGPSSIAVSGSITTA